jgi:hypothetical protein
MTKIIESVYLIVLILMLLGCSLLSPQQDNKSNFNGDNANVVQNYLSGITNEQLIIGAIVLAVLCIACGLMLGMTIQYLIKKYGMLFGLIYLLSGFVVSGSVLFLGVWAFV